MRPDNPNIVYSGAIGSAPGGGGVLLRYDHATAQIRIITAWPEEYSGYGPKDLKYRFQWTYPILISPHDPDVLYIAGNVLFRSTDDGASWEVISPDLTRDDPSKQEASGGPITKDTTGAEHYCTIFAFVESTHQQGLFWAGSDDGLMHLSRDGGANWQEITPPELPEWATVATIELSPHDEATAYVAAFRYKLDDYRPYLFKTADYGATWTRITGNLPDDDFTRVIREDPERPGLLYAGTERGVHVSSDDGASWQPFQCNLPVAPIHDLAIRGDDLIAATHGRSFWITDGLALLRQLAAGEVAPVHLFAPAPTLRMAGEADPTAVSPKQYMVGLGQPGTLYVAQKPDGGFERRPLDCGVNPRAGVVLHYHLQEEPEGEVTLSFHDADGQEIRGFGSVEPETPDEEEGKEQPPKDPVIPAKAGMNRFAWDMRYPGSHPITGTTDRPPGPLAAPGRYEARLTVAGTTHRQPFEIPQGPAPGGHAGGSGRAVRAGHADPRQGLGGQRRDQRAAQHQPSDRRVGRPRQGRPRRAAGRRRGARAQEGAHGDRGGAGRAARRGGAEPPQPPGQAGRQAERPDQRGDQRRRGAAEAGVRGVRPPGRPDRRAARPAQGDPGEPLAALR